MASAIALHNVPEGDDHRAGFATQRRYAAGAAFVLAVLIGCTTPEGMAVRYRLSRRNGRIRAVLITAAGHSHGARAMAGILARRHRPPASRSLGFASGAML